VADDGRETSILRLRFPDGDVELRWTTKELPVGILVRSRGTLWPVSRHERGSIVLEPASPEDQAQYGPVVKPRRGSLGSRRAISAFGRAPRFTSPPVIVN
jgi:hypothetical protein